MAGGRPRKKREEKTLTLKHGAPACPEFLDETAKAKWRDLVAALKTADILAHADVDTMARYCSEYATWRRANDKIQTEGEVLKGPNGGDIQNPYLSVRSKAAIQLNKMSEQLGLDPLSRQRLHVSTEAAEADAKSRFFAGREGK